jgi:hypothetical protein
MRRFSFCSGGGFEGCGEPGFGGGEAGSGEGPVGEDVMASGQQSGSFHLALAVSSQVVALSVTDDGGTGTAPKAEHADQDATHGRGLGMVSAIAHRVVIHDSQAGHTITAELFTSARPGGHPC